VGIEILRYSDRHIDGVRDLIVPIQRAEFGIAITYDEQPDLQDIPGFYQSGKGGFWVALDGADVVGSIGLVDIGDDRGALRKMFVKQAYRGAVRGVARALLEKLVAHAVRNGVTEIYLGTTARFIAAHRFYEKAGFDLIDAAALPESFPRMAVDTRFYWRRLP
jgi:GNAT superfamily N-acetyltransferase